MSLIKKTKRKISKALRGTITSDELLDELRSKGAQIGNKVIVYSPNSVTIDRSRPWLLKIGSYTQITSGVVVLTHDYSLSVLRRVYGPWIGEGAATVIGENCFIGINSVLLMGAHLGNNVIVGAGSVVRGHFPDNVVIAGNPAKVICSLEDHYNNRIKKTAEEAKTCARIYYERFKKKPTPADLTGFKFLFAPRDESIVKKYKLSFECNGDEPSEVEAAFYSSTPLWDNFEEFLKDAGL